MQTVFLDADVVVIGGGLPGVCAAIAAQRGGAETILLERSMTLGGNCGPEVGVHPSDGHRFHPYMAATGIVGEIIDAATAHCAKTNTADHHYNVSQQWDTVMADALRREGVRLLRRHYAHTPVVKNGRITALHCEDTATYKHVCIKVRSIVIDASGDGNVSAEAGALFRMGREGKDEYGERMAPDKADKVTLGSSLVALVRKTDHEVKFTPPESMPEFFPGYWGEVSFCPGPDETLRFFFPTETGGEMDTIEDDHLIYERLLGQLYSAWNRVKNVTHVEQSKNWELLWVSPKIGKRESRRFIGDYVLTGTDVEHGRVFDDAIAVGGFYTDAHYPNPKNEQYVVLIEGSMPPTYTIPYRSIYSKNIHNLMFASRLLSVSHLAHASVRVQRTLASIAHASGTAAAMCTEKGVTPRQLGQTHIKELQQLLLEQDACIPIKQNDLKLIEKAVLEASSQLTAAVCGEKQFITVCKDMGLQLWNFGSRLDSVSFYMKGGSADQTLSVRLLRYHNETPWQERRLQFGTFQRFPVHNETEWGLDNRTAKYQELAVSSAVLPAGFEGYVSFAFNTALAEKDIMNDEDKLIIVFGESSDAQLAVSDRPYDFARLVTGSGENGYSVCDGAPFFALSPEVPFGECENLKNGYTRRFSTNPMNMWRPAQLPATLTMRWENTVSAKQVDIYFDTIMRTYREEPFECAKAASPQCVTAFEVLFYNGDTLVKKERVTDNRVRKCSICAGISFDRIVLTLLATSENALPGIYKIDIQ